MDDMGVFRTTIEVQNLDMLGPRKALPETMVDTGSEYTWIPRQVLEELSIRAQRKQASNSPMVVVSSAISAMRWCAQAGRKHPIWSCSQRQET